jgi:hypothetical protein
MKASDRHWTASRDRRGTVLVAAVVVLMVCMGLGLMLFLSARSRGTELAGRLDDRRAEALAEAALSEAMTAVAEGSSGNVGTLDAPALLGDGVFWVTAEDLAAGGPTRLVATALQGTGRASLTAVVQAPGEEPLFKATLQSDEEMTLASGVMVDSFSSKEGTYASQVLSTFEGFDYGNGEGDVASNAGIILNADAHVFGDATPGPTSSVVFNTDSYVQGSTTPAPQVFAFPPIEYPAMAPGGAYSVPVGGSQAIPSGTYSFTSLSIGKDAVLSIKGPATIEVANFVGGKSADLVIDATDGPVTFFVSGTYTHTAGFEANAVSGSPMALAFFYGGTAPVVFPNLTKVRGAYYAPDADILFSNDNEAWGSFAANKITMSSTMKFHYDEDLAEYWDVEGNGSGTVEVYARFPGPVEPATLLANRGDPFVVLGLDKAALKSPADAWVD